MNRPGIAAVSVFAFAFAACGGSGASADDSGGDAAATVANETATSQPESKTDSASTPLESTTQAASPTRPPATTPTPAPGRSTKSPAEASCPARDSALCAFAEQVEDWVQASDFASVFAFGKPTTYQCPGPKPSGLGGNYPLCDGALAGEKRDGYPLALHGSSGEVRSEDQLIEALAARTSNATTLAAVACAWDGSTTGSCKEEFALVMATGTNPAALYLSFDRSPETGQPRLVAAGFAGDIAQTLLNGGEASIQGIGKVTVSPV